MSDEDSDNKKTKSKSKSKSKDDKKSKKKKNDKESGDDKELSLKEQILKEIDTFGKNYAEHKTKIKAMIKSYAKNSKVKKPKNSKELNIPDELYKLIKMKKATKDKAVSKVWEWIKEEKLLVKQKDGEKKGPSKFKVNKKLEEALSSTGNKIKEGTKCTMVEMSNYVGKRLKEENADNEEDDKKNKKKKKKPADESD